MSVYRTIGPLVLIKLCLNYNLTQINSINLFLSIVSLILLIQSMTPNTLVVDIPLFVTRIRIQAGMPS